MGRIKIEIVETITEEFPATEQVCTKETATDKVEPDYNGKSKVVFDREFSVQNVTKTRERKVELLSQEIEDGSKFNLSAVIAAINNLKLEASIPVLTPFEYPSAGTKQFAEGQQ